MSKERLVAFTDAVLAIIMTILVLELERPKVLTWGAFWDLRTNFFAYTISFFWLGTMWVNMHRSWDRVEKINNTLVWISVLLLFFSSFFPYTTSIVSSNFNNSVAQGVYGIIVILVSLVNVWMYAELGRVSTDQELILRATRHNYLMILDIAIKVIGLIISLTVWPPAMMWAVLLTAFVLIMPRAVRG
ncbi:DUF1211 domain-containing protein [Alloscardovia theropitheci]|uniref:DUF1211 domain-containing protein n=2 Tax=Alloscardovia theropitheci TaxID=2496842 RepID=A0A4R0QYQ6_9BIFI|nr:DUF1211 domain-containing protein [Alloscardovia theropitheci]